MDYSNLRPHQKKAIDGLRSRWKSDRWHLINASAGAGKTAIASYLCGSFAKAGKKVVFAAPYVALVDQTWRKFQEYGMDAPSVIWQKDQRYDSSKLIQIASADTLISRKDEVIPDGTEVFIWDECHIRRKGLLEELQNRPEIKVIGLSATPFAKWMGTYYTNFIKPCTANELISQGWLTPFDIVHPDIKLSMSVMDGVKSRSDSITGESDYAIGEAAEAMMSSKVVGNILENWLKDGRNLPTIGFATNKASANAYCREFQAAGIPSAVIVDNTPTDERQEIFRAFDSGAIRVIWNVGVLGAGFDADVRCIIWARPTKSETVWIQGVMRGSRPANGKSECLLFDHTPSYFNLGAPNDIEYYELHDGSDGMEEARKQRREKEKFEARKKLCRKCGRMKDEKEYQCRQCGHKPLGGEAVECDESVGMVRADKTKSPKFTKEDKQRIYSELIGWQLQQRQRGKNVSDGRISHLYRERVGVWPKGLGSKPAEPSPDTLNYIKSNQIRYAKGRAKHENK
jgi:DNA repair protein RadD